MSGPGHEDGGLDSYGFREWVVITVPRGWWDSCSGQERGVPQLVGM